jgi:hypothetical protein
MWALEPCIDKQVEEYSDMQLLAAGSGGRKGEYVSSVS